MKSSFLFPINGRAHRFDSRISIILNVIISLLFRKKRALMMISSYSVRLYRLVLAKMKKKMKKLNCVRRQMKKKLIYQFGRGLKVSYYEYLIFKNDRLSSRRYWSYKTSLTWLFPLATSRAERLNLAHLWELE